MLFNSNNMLKIMSVHTCGHLFKELNFFAWETVKNCFQTATKMEEIGGKLPNSDSQLLVCLTMT